MLVKDPVCGQEVSPRKAEKAGLKASRGGKTYYFHSEECKRHSEKSRRAMRRRRAAGASAADPHAAIPSGTKGHAHK